MPDSPATLEPAAPPAAPAADTNAQDANVPPLVKWLMDTGITEKADGTPDKKPDEPVKPADGKPPAELAKPGDKPADKPVDTPIGLRRQKLARPALPFVEEPKPKAPVVPAADAKPDPQWEASLESNEKGMISSAREAEKLFPDKYKGLGSRTENFLKAHAKFISDKGDDFDDQSPEYRQFLDKNQPRLSNAEVREIESAIIKADVAKEWQGKHADLQHKLYVRDEEPKVEAEARKIFVDLSNTALPDEVVAAIKKDGYDKAAETYGLEIETAQNVLTAATDDLKEFIRISRKDPETGRPLATIAANPSDPKYQQHARLSVMIKSVCDNFKATAAADQQFQNGKWFVTRDEWNRIRPDQRGQFWTFTNQQLTDRAKAGLKGVVANAIKGRHAEFERYKFKRVPNSATDKPDKPPVATPREPAGGPVAAPGPSDSPPSTIDRGTTTILSNLQKEPAQ